MAARPFRTVALLAAITLSAAFLTVRPAAAADVPYTQLAADRGPTLVGLKYILKIQAPAEMGGPQERQQEITGLMIDKTGLILCPLSALMAGLTELPAGVTVNPTDVKVLIGEDAEGAAAKVVARDSELDLAWIKIDKPAEKGYTSMDLSQSVSPKQGDTLLFVDRMGNYYDRATFVGEVKVAATLKKPRNLIQPSGLIFSLCTPVFSADGKFAGVTVRQGPGRDEMQGAAMADRLYAQLLKVLPTAELEKATKRALENAAKEPPAEEKKADEKKPEEKKDGGSAPAPAPAPTPAPAPAPAPAPKQ